MNKPKHHILICTSSRIKGEPVGACTRRNSPDLIQYIESEITDRALDGILVTNTGCLKVCDDGPVMVIYPEGHWYGKLDEAAIDAILDALEDGQAAEELLL